MKSMKKGIICVLVCTLMIISTIIPVSANTLSEKTFQPLAKGKTLYVGGVGPNNYTKIQDAVNASSNGYTVFVYGGMYNENVVIEKSITLKGENKNTTIISGPNTGAGVWISSNRVRVQGFTIQTHNYEAVIFASVSFVVISDNIIQNGISLSKSQYNIIMRNNISDGWYGIDIYASSHSNILIDNVLSYNKIGVILDYFDVRDNIVSRNIITHNSLEGILLRGCRYNLITGNTIEENTLGIRLNQSRQNLIMRNNFLENQQDAYFNCTTPLQDNRFLRNYWNQSLTHPKIIHGVTGDIRKSEWQNWIEIDWLPASEPYVIP